MKLLFFPFQISTSVTNRYQAAAKCVQTMWEASTVPVIQGTPIIVAPTHVYKVGHASKEECVNCISFFLFRKQIICCEYSKELNET